jgi:hypothetical protein
MTEDDQDDYLSDKFLADAASTSSTTKTYSQLRKEAQRQAKLKNDKNKLKSRHQREMESREEGLSKSLFERVIEEEKSGIGQGSKALNIMMKMGFKPGQPLGKTDDDEPTREPQLSPSDVEETEPKHNRLKHITVPLPINDEWKGSCVVVVRYFYQF